MNIRFGVVLFGLFAVAASPAIADEAIGFTTQDQNGFHLATITPEAAVVHLVADGKHAEKLVKYTPDRFHSAWRRIEELRELGFGVAMGSDAEQTHPATNYVVMLSTSSGEQRGFLFSKCERNAKVDDVMRQLTAGLLPEGSPGRHPKGCPAE